MLKRLKNNIKSAWETVREAIALCRRDKMSVYASQSAYFTLFSIIPLLLLALTLLKYFIPYDEAELIKYLANVLPEEYMSVTSRIVGEIYGKASIPLISISGLLIFWAAVAGLRSLTSGIKSIYKAHTSIPVSGESKGRATVKSELLSALYTIILLLLITVAFICEFRRDELEARIVENLPAGTFFSWLFIVMYDVVLIILLTAVITIFFWALSGASTKITAHAPGALLASLGWCAFSLLFVIYIKRFSAYSYLYGSISLLIIFMLWLYICMNILFIGVEANVYISERKSERN